MQILLSGSLAYDRIMSFPDRFSNHILPENIHILNVAFTVSGLEEKFGGTAGNIAYTLSLLEERPLILSTVGADFARYAAWLQKNRLGLEGIRVIEGELTAGAYIVTDQADNQITAWNPGAMNHPSGFRPGVNGHEKRLGVVSPGNLEDMLGYSREFKALNLPYIFDPGQATTSFSGPQLEEMITGSDILVSNDYELALIKKATDLTEAALMDRTGLIITTLGEKGSLIKGEGETISVPAARARVVLDPTGAGDAFRAGLIKGLAQGRAADAAAKMGAVAASFAVQYLGTQEHHFTLDEFWARFEDNFGPRA